MVENSIKNSLEKKEEILLKKICVVEGANNFIKISSYILPISELRRSILWHKLRWDSPLGPIGCRIRYGVRLIFALHKSR